MIYCFWVYNRIRKKFLWFLYMLSRNNFFSRRKSVNVNVFYVSFLFISRVEFNERAYEVMKVFKYTFKYDIHYHWSNNIVRMQRCGIVANLKWLQEKFLKIKETVGIETPNTLHDSLVLENLVKWKGINVMWLQLDSNSEPLNS